MTSSRTRRLVDDVSEVERSFEWMVQEYLAPVSAKRLVGTRPMRMGMCGRVSLGLVFPGRDARAGRWSEGPWSTMTGR